MNTLLKAVTAAKAIHDADPTNIEDTQAYYNLQNAFDNFVSKLMNKEKIECVQEVSEYLAIR
jgi:hypothetical protein